MAETRPQHVVDYALSETLLARALIAARSDGCEPLLLGSDSLPARGWHRLRGIRQRYAVATADWPEGAPVIYHQLIGLDLFATEDERRHRIYWIHEPFVRWGTALGWAARYVDAFVFADPEWRAEAAEALPWLPANRLVLAEKDSSAAEICAPLADLKIKRRFGSPAGWIGLYGLYRQQLKWMA